MREWERQFVDLRTEYLSDEDAAALYREHPQVPKSPDHGCPTCDGIGKYRWRGEDRFCDCEEQLQLHKHYLRAGIGDVYQRLDWDDYEGDPLMLATAEDYLKSHPNFVQTGIGLYLHGEFGAGKTFIVSLVAKALVRLGYDVFFSTFQGMVQMFTAGWHSDADRARFEDRIIQSEVMVLDDIGKEFRTTTNLPQSLFDHVLRQRVTNARPTLLTTNDTKDQIGKGYGGAILSLLGERSIMVESKGVDFRPKARDRAVMEAMAGERRPIV